MVAEKLQNAEPLHSIAIPGNPSLATRHRWRLNGIVHHGERIRLEAWRVGGRLVTTPEAVDAFIVALTAEPEREADPPREDRKGSKRDAEDLARRGQQAGKALEALGC